MSNNKILKEFFENGPLYSRINLPFPNQNMLQFYHILNEIEKYCEVCEISKPFHNTNKEEIAITVNKNIKKSMSLVHFKCVTCKSSLKSYWLRTEIIEQDCLTLLVSKIGEQPQNELPKSKELAKFFKEDKDEYNKAVICLAHGYGVAAFAYMRRIVENNIDNLLSLISEIVDTESSIANSISGIKTTSPMSEKIKIVNKAMPDHLKPDGFNPLGQIYALLSEGVHSLPDEECLDKAKDLQFCLEFLISELASHKENKEKFKQRLSALRKK